MGLLDKFKLVEPVRDEEAEQRERYEQVKGMWIWLRIHLDKAALYYQRTGQADHPEAPLTGCLAGQALQDVIAHLDHLRSRGLLWSYPDREQRAATRLRIDDQVGNTYVITEYFRDYSRLEYWGDSDRPLDVREANGEERALRATIQVNDDDTYHITNIVLLSE